MRLIIFRCSEINEIAYIIKENNVDDKVEDDTIFLESDTRKKTLTTSRIILHNFFSAILENNTRNFGMQQGS